MLGGKPEQALPLSANICQPADSDPSQEAHICTKKGKHRLIDKVDVRFVESDKKFWATLHNFGSRYVHIPEEIVYKYDRLPGGGVWCQIDLVYNDFEDAAQKTPFYISALKPIQVAAFDRSNYIEARRYFSRDDWLDLVIRSVGLEPAAFDLRTKLLAVTHLIPMVESNYNLSTGRIGLLGMHYYLPGWELPKLEKRLFTDHFGFVSDYFAEALRQLRKQSHEC